MKLHSVVYAAEWAQLSAWIRNAVPGRSAAEWVTDNATIPHEPDEPGWVTAPGFPWLAAYRFNDEPSDPYVNQFLFAWELGQFTGVQGKLSCLLAAFYDQLLSARSDPLHVGSDEWRLLRPDKVATLTAIWCQLSPHLDELRISLGDDSDLIATMLANWGTLLRCANHHGWAVFFRWIPLAEKCDP